MSGYTLCCLALLSACVVNVIARPHKHHWKGMVKRWDLLSEYDPELKGQVPSNCDDIVAQYTNGKILMFEYKIKMKRCMSKKDVLAPDHKALTKSSIADAFAPSDATPTEGDNQVDQTPDYSQNAQGPDNNQNTQASDYSQSMQPSDNTANAANSYGTEANADTEHAQYSPNEQGPEPTFDAQSTETINQTGDQQLDITDKPEDMKRTELQGVPAAAAQPLMTPDPMMTPEQQNQPIFQQDPSANFYPAQDQNQYATQSQAPLQAEAAFAPNSNPAPESPPLTQPVQDTNQFVARSDVPNAAPAAPAQGPAQTVMDQWGSSSFGASDAKKDQVPAPNGDIAQFMNSQQPNADTGLLAVQQPQQRSDIQPQPQPQPAAFNQGPSGPENNLPF